MPFGDFEGNVAHSLKTTIALSVTKEVCKEFAHCVGALLDYAKGLRHVFKLDCRASSDDATMLVKFVVMYGW